MGHVNESEVEAETVEHGDEVQFRRTKLGDAAGGERLGASLYELPAGTKAWPYHWHTANEEALYVLAGEGSLRYDGGTVSLEPGDYVAFPTGPEGAHRVVNDSDDTLRYLVVSEMREPDVLGYPDSEKVGVYAGTPPGGDESERVLSGFFREEDAVDFWEGE
jgi:uncharacterized cupin superfamily protein